MSSMSAAVMLDSNFVLAVAEALAGLAHRALGSVSQIGEVAVMQLRDPLAANE